MTWWAILWFCEFCPSLVNHTAVVLFEQELVLASVLALDPPDLLFSCCCTVTFLTFPEVSFVACKAGRQGSCSQEEQGTLLKVPELPLATFFSLVGHCEVLRLPKSLETLVKLNVICHKLPRKPHQDVDVGSDQDGL